MAAVGEHTSNSMMGATGFGNTTVEEQVRSPGLRESSFLHKAPADRKQMLEIGKESEKLKVMRMVVQEMAHGNDQSDLFPSVVKCVVCKSLELKKLVYMYLVRYADELPDLALLSISTFQKGLKDPNQLIRASALRVLSSIRVPVIVPIMLISLKQAATDMSPYVRKTAAHAIAKLYALAPGERESLIEVLEQLLHDRVPMVIGSVIMAFEEVCPERLDLLHKHYRKLCNVLADVDEYGQISVLNLLLRYARTQFLDPNQGTMDVKEQPFYAESESSGGEGEEVGEDGTPAKAAYIMDPDHRLLLRTCLSLLHSRNAGVILSVAQIYFYLAPTSEMSMVIKPLVRQLHGPREVQHMVLLAITSLTITRKQLFEPYLKSFFVRSGDPRFIRLLKLEIMTAIANETNVSQILREFQAYVRSDDKTFATATIQCIGRCASKLANVTESCLSGLMMLMSKRDEAIVAESVVVIKKLLQLDPEAHKDIIVTMAKLANSTTVPMARASILWMIGEYSVHVPKIAPDVLRQMAITFPDEEDIVKLQVVNLAAKLFITNHKQAKLLTNYVLNLAKYDTNYDIRDRARVIRAILMNKESKLYKHSKALFLSEKPAPNLQSQFSVRDRFNISSLSHALDLQCHGFLALPDFPTEAPDSSVRNVVEEKPVILETTKSQTFYGDNEEEESDSNDSSSSSSSGSGSGSGSDSDSDGSGSDSSGSGSSDSEDDDHHHAIGSDTDTESESEDSTAPPSRASSDPESSSSSESSDSDSDNSDDERPVIIKGGAEPTSAAAAPTPSKSTTTTTTTTAPVKATPTTTTTTTTTAATKSSAAATAPTTKKDSKKSKPKEANLLDLDFSDTPSTSVGAGAGASGTSGARANSSSSAMDLLSMLAPTSTPLFATQPWKEVLNKIAGKGLVVEYMISRRPASQGAKYISIDLRFTLHGQTPLTNLKIVESATDSGISLVPFTPFTIEGDEIITKSIAVDTKDSIKPIPIELTGNAGADAVTHRFNIEITAGDIVRGADINYEQFTKEQAKLTGMNENSANITVSDVSSVVPKVQQACYLSQIYSTAVNNFYFAGRSLSGSVLVLVHIDAVAGRLTVNCEQMIFGSNIFKVLKAVFN